jgi:hypothetical protein
LIQFNKREGAEARKSGWGFNPSKS